MTQKPVLAITMGDINGVGPEILAKALARPEPWQHCQPIVLGSGAALDAARVFAPDLLPLKFITMRDSLDDLAACIPVCEGDIPIPAQQPGIIDPEAGRCAVEWIKTATHWAIEGKTAGLVTCPISKTCIYQAGYHYIGHTELVAELSNSPGYRMCLFADAMRIVHNTGHLSLRDALDAITVPRLLESIKIGYDVLLRIGIVGPRIAVAGLNPHAGEDGAFGQEEIEIVAPAIAVACEQGMHCVGPVPPDTVFRRMALGEFDMVIALYHDQGHIPLKLIAMDEGVNVTLGIPIVRTSVDHGTAFDIAGKGIASEESLLAAIRLASQLASQKESR